LKTDVLHSEQTPSYEEIFLIQADEFQALVLAADSTFSYMCSLLFNKQSHQVLTVLVKCHCTVKTFPY